MCKQDVTIGRATRTQQANYAIAPLSLPTLAVGPRADRLGVSITGVWSAVASPEIVTIGVYASGTMSPIAGITPDHPTVDLSIKEWGDILQGPLYILDSGTNNCTVTVTDQYLNQTLESL